MDLRQVLKTKHRFLIILSVLFLLMGCGSSEKEGISVLKTWDSGNTAEESTEEGAVEEDAEDVSEKIIGMVSDVGGINDKSFNQSAWEGLQSINEDYGSEITYSEVGEGGDYTGSFNELIDKDCDLNWGIGYRTADAILEAAAKEPDRNYAVIDSAYEDTPSNVTGVVFRAQEPSFIVGYIAALATKNGKIGFVGGVHGEIIDQFEYGYRAGVLYASMVYGKNVEVDIEYADSFADEVRGKEIAERMYNEGCDIVYHAAGASGIGVIEAAKEMDKYAIGVDRDQSDLAPDNVLTSAMKLVNVAIVRVTESYLKDEDIGGKTLSFGLTEGAVGIPAEHKNYRDEIYDAALVIEDLIESGSIVPPANEADYQKFVETLE